MGSHHQASHCRRSRIVGQKRRRMCVAVWPRAQLALGPSGCTALAAGARVRLCDTGRLAQTREKMLARCVNRNMTGALLTCSTISLRRIAPSPRTFTRSPWLPDLASMTTCARSRGRTAPPPPSPSRTLTSRLSIAPATNRDAGRTPLIQCFVSYSLHCEGGSGAKA